MSVLARAMLWLLAALVVAAQVPQARSDEPGIWDRVIMAQPFDSRPFRQIKIPAWVEETIGCGYTLSGMDGEARARAAAHGVTISEMGFVDPFYAYYDSKLLERRSPHVPLGRLEQDIAEYKRLGVRILGVYPPCLQGEVYEKHPDWRRIATNTTRDSPDRPEAVSARRHAVPAGSLRRLLHRRAGRDRRRSSRTSTPSASTACTTAASAIASTAARTTATTPAARFPTSI